MVWIVCSNYVFEPLRSVTVDEWNVGVMTIAAPTSDSIGAHIEPSKITFS